MERKWHVITPVDGVEKCARIQRYAENQKGRGGGQKDSRKRQPEDGLMKNPANAGGDVSEFHGYLIRQFLIKMQADNQTMKESIENMGIEKHASSSTKSFSELLALRLAAR